MLLASTHSFVRPVIKDRYAFGGLVYDCGNGCVGVQVQRSEHVYYLEQQKRFLIDPFDEIRVVRDGDVVILEFSADPKEIPATKGFGLYDQIVYGPLVLPYFIQFLDTWKFKPRIYTYWLPDTEAEDTPGGLRFGMAQLGAYSLADI